MAWPRGRGARGGRKVERWKGEREERKDKEEREREKRNEFFGENLEFITR